MKKLLKLIIVFCLIGGGNINASIEDCSNNDCLSALLKSDLLEANSDEVFKYFDDFPELAFKSWKSMKDFPGVRINLDHLRTLTKVSERFAFANKAGFEGLTELFKTAKTSNVDAVLDGLKKADEIFDTSLPITIGAKKSGSQIFANVTDGDGNLVCRIVGGKLSKKQIIPNGTKVGKYDDLDIVQIGNRVGFLEEVNWTTTGDLYKNAKLGAEIGDGAGANKKVFIVDDGNNDKVIALLREGKNVNVLNNEVEALQQLSSKGFPVVEIIEKTVHINPTTKIGTPAIVMKKYAKGSEQIADVFGNEIKIIADVDALKVVTNKSIDDLNAIKQMMIDKNVSIDDLQFLISSDGRFVIADPVGANFASTPSKVNLDLIDELINQVIKAINNAGGNLPTRLVEGKNIFRASSQEYSLAKKSFKEYREGVIYEQSKILSGDDLTVFKNEFNGKNIAKVEGKIDDVPLDNSFRRSGDEFDGEPIFDAYKVDKEGNIDVDGAWSREWDTEYVMLSEIAKSKGAVKGGVYPKVTGEIIISSELPYCVSCQGVIQDFSDMFPNLDVILIDGLR